MEVYHRMKTDLYKKEFLKETENSPTNLDMDSNAIYSNDYKDECTVSCTLCGQEMIFRNFKYHINKVHGDDTKSAENFVFKKKIFHRCALCFQSLLLTTNAIRNHVVSAHKMKLPDYNKKFMAPIILDRRGKNKGHQKPPQWCDGTMYKCPFCFHIYYRYFTFRIHLINSHNVLDSKERTDYLKTSEILTDMYECKLCTLTIKRDRMDIEAHLKDKHQTTLRLYTEHFESGSDATDSFQETVDKLVKTGKIFNVNIKREEGEEEESEPAEESKHADEFLRDEFDATEEMIKCEAVKIEHNGEDFQKKDFQEFLARGIDGDKGVNKSHENIENGCQIVKDEVFEGLSVEGFSDAVTDSETNSEETHSNNASNGDVAERSEAKRQRKVPKRFQNDGFETHLLGVKRKNSSVADESVGDTQVNEGHLISKPKLQTEKKSRKPSKVNLQSVEDSPSESDFNTAIPGITALKSPAAVPEPITSPGHPGKRKRGRPRKSSLDSVDAKGRRLSKSPEWPGEPPRKKPVRDHWKVFSEVQKGKPENQQGEAKKIDENQSLRVKSSSASKKGKRMSKARLGKSIPGSGSKKKTKSTLVKGSQAKIRAKDAMLRAKKIITFSPVRLTGSPTSQTENDQQISARKDNDIKSDSNSLKLKNPPNQIENPPVGKKSLNKGKKKIGAVVKKPQKQLVRKDEGNTKGKENQLKLEGRSFKVINKPSLVKNPPVKIKLPDKKRKVLDKGTSSAAVNANGPNEPSGSVKPDKTETEEQELKYSCPIGNCKWTCNQNGLQCGSAVLHLLRIHQIQPMEMKNKGLKFQISV